MSGPPVTDAYEGYFLDLDGLLLDTERIGLSTFLETGRAHGTELDERLYLELLGMSRKDGDRRIASRLSGQVDVTAFLTDWNRRFRDTVETDPDLVKPDAHGLLERFAQSPGTLACVTNSTAEDGHWKIERAGLDRYFDFVVTSSDVENGKPAPDIYLLAAERAGADPARSLAMEDSPGGVRAALAAGMHVLEVPHRAACGVPVPPGARHTLLRSLAEAVAWLGPTDT